MKFRFFALLFTNFGILSFTQIQGQEKFPDTLLQLPSASVRAYLDTQPYLELISSVGLVTNDLLKLQQGNTLLPSLNTIPGVRMEERSPGSYRLSIRGSLLRSPFGIRNIKIYLDEIPLTDAGGNTYLNALGPSAIHNLTILKGPDGSLFGANSGGVILITPQGAQNDTSSHAIIGASGGSYGLYHQQIGGNIQVNPQYSFGLNYDYQRADGYRQNTASKRHYLQTVQRFKYNPSNELRFVGFYSTMGYSTPGGLTESQYLENPRQARPAAGPNPGASEQQAAIYNNTLSGGLIHEAKINDQLKHVITAFGSYTDFSNPFITNYEKKKKKNIGFRSYLNYERNDHQNFTWAANAGVEWQQGKSDILNYDNNKGNKGNEQAGDALKNHQHFYFMKLSANIIQRINIETALSLNYYYYSYKNLFPEPSLAFRKVTFNAAWMPRFAISYLITPNISWRGSIGKGFSPATSAEVRSSDNIINTALQPETGWNKETGIRWQSNNNRFQLDASVFSYRMHNAIVRLTNDDGAEYFTNAGGVKQRGLEAAVSAWIIQPQKSSFIRGLQLATNITWSHFRFNDYVDNGSNYSGNKLTGVPENVFVTSTHFLLPKGFSLYAQHNFTSSIPLNDANTAQASSYHLVQTKIMWNSKFHGKYMLSLSGGIDNLLNKSYSLGNDINAFGGRYFNAAMPRNYYLGLNLSI